MMSEVTLPSAIDSCDKSLRLFSLDALIRSPVADWSQEKLIASIELLTCRVNQDKFLYLSERRKLVALHLALNRRKGPSPALRSTVKVLPKMAYDGGRYPVWAKAASNDKQLTDLDFVLQRYPEFVSFTRSKYEICNSAHKYDIDAVQDFIWDVGSISHKLDSLNLPKFLLFSLQSLKTSDIHKQSRSISKSCVAYEQILRKRMHCDRRSRLDESSVTLRLQVLRSLSISNMLGTTKNSDVNFYLECLTGLIINAGSLSRLLQQIRKDIKDSEVIPYDRSEASPQ
jgi:hypothetical protein